MLSNPVVKDTSEDSDALIADLVLGEFGSLSQWRCLTFVLLTLTPCVICHILLLL